MIRAVVVGAIGVGSLSACFVDRLVGKACDEAHPCVREETCVDGVCTPLRTDGGTTSTRDDDDDAGITEDAGPDAGDGPRDAGDVDGGVRGIGG